MNKKMLLLIWHLEWDKLFYKATVDFFLKIQLFCENTFLDIELNLN